MAKKIKKGDAVIFKYSNYPNNKLKVEEVDLEAGKARCGPVFDSSDKLQQFPHTCWFPLDSLEKK